MEQCQTHSGWSIDSFGSDEMMCHMYLGKWRRHSFTSLASSHSKSLGVVMGRNIFMPLSINISKYIPVYISTIFIYLISFGYKKEKAKRTGLNWDIQAKNSSLHNTINWKGKDKIWGLYQLPKAKCSIQSIFLSQVVLFFCTYFAICLS